MLSNRSGFTFISVACLPGDETVWPETSSDQFQPPRTGAELLTAGYGSMERQIFDSSDTNAWLFQSEPSQQ